MKDVHYSYGEGKHSIAEGYSKYVHYSYREEINFIKEGYQNP